MVNWVYHGRIETGEIAPWLYNSWAPSICPSPFDPSVCIDENGTGWLTFGGGTPASGAKVHTNIPKIVKLGKDMLSFDSEFFSIDAPYFFEASELNYEISISFAPVFCIR